MRCRERRSHERFYNLKDLAVTVLVVMIIHIASYDGFNHVPVAVGKEDPTHLALRTVLRLVLEVEQRCWWLECPLEAIRLAISGSFLLHRKLNLVLADLHDAYTHHFRFHLFQLLTGPPEIPTTDTPWLS
jgi:hypothetical protein